MIYRIKYDLAMVKGYTVL